jgi:hypothetical protein
MLLVSCNEAPANDVEDVLDSVENEATDNTDEASTDSIMPNVNNDEMEEKETKEEVKPAKTDEQLDAEMEMEMYEELERLSAFKCEHCGEKSCEGDCQK